MSNQSPYRAKVAVLRGGPSYAYENSLESGKNVLARLRDMPESYEPVDIFVSRDGEWHVNGAIQEPVKALKYADVVWNALHGEYGEDGQVQKLLDGINIPYTGSKAFSSALAINKDLSKRAYNMYSLRTPQHELIDKNTFSDDAVVSIFRTYLHPVIVKPVNKSFGLGIRVAHTFAELKDAILEAFGHGDKVMVEEFVRGKTVSCVVLDHARGEKLYALVPVEQKGNEYIYPGTLSVDQNKEIERMARAAHDALGMRHYSVSDFIITPKGNIYILETNSHPDLSENSLIQKTLSAVGFGQKEFFDHILKLTLGREI